MIKAGQWVSVPALMDELEPPTFTDDKKIKPGYVVPESVDLDIHRLSHELGKSKNEIVAVFLRWAIDAYRKGYRP